MRLARDRAGGCTPGEPLSYLRQERVRDRTGQAAFLPTARAGAWPHRTSRPLACGKGGGLHPRRAAFLPTARAESTILQLGGNTRTRAEDLHRPSVSERPQARSKVLCQAFFQETAEILRPLAVQLQNHRVSGEGFGAVVLADGLNFPV